ncbi:MAG: helix-turn-helix domain-containing protein [Candidatus Binatus sp.]
MPALDRAPSPAPRFNSFADPAHTTLYDQIGHSIGGDAADKLIADLGGRRLYIPITPTSGSTIARSIGLLAALAMARAFGGDRLLIPVTSDHLRRRVRIVEMRAGRVSISRIARELRCTERYVYKVLASNRTPEIHSCDCSRSFKQRGRGLGSSTTSAPIAERLKRGHINQRS